MWRHSVFIAIPIVECRVLEVKPAPAETKVQHSATLSTILNRARRPRSRPRANPVAPASRSKPDRRADGWLISYGCGLTENDTEALFLPSAPLFRRVRGSCISTHRPASRVHCDHLVRMTLTGENQVRID